MARGAATRLLETVWSNAQGATDHSWERLNTAMRKTLALAVGAGFKFTKADFAGLEKFRSGYWIGEQEWVYSMAVAEGNYSAAVAYEQWVGREPIIADGVTPVGCRFAHLAHTRDRERLHVGCYFVWEGEKVKVTSFTEQGSAVACLYHPAKGEYGHESKVKRRYCITREAVIAARAESKQRQAIVKELTGMFDRIKAVGIDCAKEFGVKKTAELNAIPFKRFERIAERIKKKVAAAPVRKAA